MKLLLDQNISFRVLKLLPESFSASRHVNEVKLNGAKDLEIWEFAKNESFTIVTFDSDFCDIANLKGHPPKIIWLRIGNSNKFKIAEKLTIKEDVILEFLMDKDKL